MLCLDEGAPVVMAMSLLGSVLFIIGGSFWGNGDLTGDDVKKVTGIVLFSCSLVFLLLAGLGCWCNRFFCTPDRKSRIAMRMYGSRPPMPAGDEDGDAESNVAPGSGTLRDSDWEEYAGSSSTYRSFRSGRNSTRNLRSRTSLRGDRVAPVLDQRQPQQKPQLQQQPLPLPPNPFIAYLNSSSNNESGSGGRIPVPIESAETSLAQNYSNGNQQVYPSHQEFSATSSHNQRDQPMRQPRIQQPAGHVQAPPLTVRSHDGGDFQSSEGGAQVSDPVLV